ncbi:MAG: aspartyl/asparaginyl beta-hydroxylase domain-containing protein [Gammaproteobacteria bacterium]|nr:aspartyl/asparaginyl beta-hydroxylase domain-containing protein [Gammaproteobacteria bacterium]
MLDLPGQPVLDKQSLIGGCLRLPLAVDAARLAAEIDALDPDVWGSGGRVGVQRPAESLFLRGYAPAEGEKPIEDRPPLAALPYTREVLALPGAAPQRCLLARLPAQRIVALHIDELAPYFHQTIRIHVPVRTHENAWMVSAGRCYRMQAGEVWALNNCAEHGVWNADASRSRTHLICDFLPSPRLLELLARGERDLGRYAPEIERQVRPQRA